MRIRPRVLCQYTYIYNQCSWCLSLQIAKKYRNICPTQQGVVKGKDLSHATKTGWQVRAKNSALSITIRMSRYCLSASFFLLLLRHCHPDYFFRSKLCYGCLWKDCENVTQFILYYFMYTLTCCFTLVYKIWISLINNCMFVFI